MEQKFVNYDAKTGDIVMMVKKRILEDTPDVYLVVNTHSESVFMMSLNGGLSIAPSYATMKADGACFVTPDVNNYWNGLARILRVSTHSVDASWPGLQSDIANAVATALERWQAAVNETVSSGPSSRTN